MKNYEIKKYFYKIKNLCNLKKMVKYPLKTLATSLKGKINKSTPSFFKSLFKKQSFQNKDGIPVDNEALISELTLLLSNFNDMPSSEDNVVQSTTSQEAKDTLKIMGEYFKGKNDAFDAILSQKVVEFQALYPEQVSLKQLKDFFVPIYQGFLDNLKSPAVVVTTETVNPETTTTATTTTSTTITPVTPIKKTVVKKKRAKTPVRSRSRSRPRELKVVEEGMTLTSGGCACGRR